MAQTKETPTQFLSRLEGKRSRIVLKWGNIYEGVFCTFDGYMNIVLSNAIEINQDKSIELGDMCIRCNNIKIIEELL